MVWLKMEGICNPDKDKPEATAEFRILSRIGGKTGSEQKRTDGKSNAFSIRFQRLPQVLTLHKRVEQCKGPGSSIVL